MYWDVLGVSIELLDGILYEAIELCIELDHWITKSKTDLHLALESIFVRFYSADLESYSYSTKNIYIYLSLFLCWTD